MSEETSFLPQAESKGLRLWRTLSVHTKIAVVSVPTLLIVAVLSCVLLAKCVVQYTEYDDAESTYLRHVLTVTENLSSELARSMIHLRDRNSLSLDDVYDKVDNAMGELINFHFRDGRAGGESSQINRVGTWVEVFQQVKLQSIRRQVSGRLLEEAEHTKVLEFYHTLMSNTLLNGARTAVVLEAHARDAMSVLAAIDVLHAWSYALDSFFTVATSPSVQSIQDSIRSERALQEADTYLHIFLKEDILIEVDKLEERPSYARFLADLSKVHTAYSVQSIDSSPQLRAAPADCNRAISAFGRELLSVEPAIADSINERNRKLRILIGTTAALLCVSFWGIAMHIVNLCLYRGSRVTVRSSMREVEKLQEALVRMDCFVGAVKDMNTESFHPPQSKGIPAPEVALYNCAAKLRDLRSYVPWAVFAPSLRQHAGGLNTELGLQMIEGVTLAVVNLGAINHTSPAEGDPMKQKLLETTGCKTIEILASCVKDRDGVLLQVSSDYAMVAWNLYSRGKMETACLSAASLLAFLEVEMSSSLTAAVATGDVLAGIVGTPTLRSGVVLGPLVPFCLQCEKLTKVHRTTFIIDSCTETFVDKAGEYRVMPIDMVEMENESDRNVVVYDFSGKLVRNDPKLGHWKQIFGMYLDGEPQEALVEMSKFMAKHGSSPLTHRFQDLCKKYPQVPRIDPLILVETIHEAGSP